MFFVASFSFFLLNLILAIVLLFEVALTTFEFSAWL